MEDTKTQTPHFPPISEVPLHKNPPLAPSQELAYRNKCIQLKRRLNEIEANNDLMRKQIGVEDDRIQKMRLLRAILLNHLRTIMEKPGRKFSEDELAKMGIAINGQADDATSGSRERAREGKLLDDSSVGSDEEEEPEPSDRPIPRPRRNNNFQGEMIMNPEIVHDQPARQQHQEVRQSLPAPFSPPNGREQPLASTIYTPQATVTSPTVSYSHQAPSQSSFIAESRLPQSPPSSHVAQPPTQPMHTHSLSRQASMTQSVVAHSPTTNGLGFPRAHLPAPAPTHPPPPFEQFTQHMRPQLEADHYPQEHISARIQEEWNKLSRENRALWDERYNEQMRDYTEAMDAFKRARGRNEPYVARQGD